MVYEQEGTYLGSLYSEVGGNERIKSRWVTLWDDDPGRLFYPFRMGFLGQDNMYGCVDGLGG